MSAALAGQDIAYLHLAALGGLRGKTAGVPPERNGLWRNASFHRYADYACTEAFAQGLQQLLLLSEQKRCALMCAEAVWWRCHRRIVADHLLAHGCQAVLHIMGAKVEASHLRRLEGRGGRVGMVSYPVGCVAARKRVPLPSPAFARSRTRPSRRYSMSAFCTCMRFWLRRAACGRFTSAARI